MVHFRDIPESGDTEQKEEEGTGRTHLFIVNPRSFRYTDGPDKVIDEIHSCFRDVAGEEYRIHISRYPRDAIGVIHKLASTVREGSIIRVYAVGGDGILFDCLNGIVGMDHMELAVVPYGSSNDFLLSFGEENIERFRDIAGQIAAGTVRTDIINCNHGRNYALNFCSIGVESASLLYTFRLTQMFSWAIRITRRIVPILYAVGGVLAILNRRYREQRYRFSLDGERVEGSFTTINIANAPYYGGELSAVTGAMPNDGVLDALFLKKGGVLQILKMLPDYLRGGYYKYPEFFDYVRVRRVEIFSEALLPVNLDGEMFFDTNISIELMPQAVDIVAVGGAEYMRRPNTHEPQ